VVALYTPKEVSELCKVSLTQARRIMEEAGAVDIGLGRKRVLRIEPEALERWIRGTIAPVTPLPARKASGGNAYVDEKGHCLRR